MYDKNPYIGIYQAVGGWQTVYLVWNYEECGGFWEPSHTGFGPYEDKMIAITEAKKWAKAEGLKYDGPEE
jgi:hypothetical protein